MPPRRVQPGTAGLARQVTNLSEARRIQNVELDRDGTWRPRWGLRWLTTFDHPITHISRPADYGHRLMLIADLGELYDLDIEDAASRTLPGFNHVDGSGGGGTGAWPQGPIASCIAQTPAAGSLWMACKAQIGASPGGLVYTYNNSTFQPPVTTFVAPAVAASVGNYIGMHGITCVILQSGCIDDLAFNWSTRGDGNTWAGANGANSKPPEPGCVTNDAFLNLTPQESLILGPSGIGVILGGDDLDPSSGNAQHSFRSAVSIATPMHHAVRGEGIALFLVAGPGVALYSPADGGFNPIDPPIHRDLFLAGGVTNIRTWYSPTRRAFCLLDLTQHLVWVYGVKEQRWLGTWTYTDATQDIYGHTPAVIDQGASAFDKATQPWAKEFVSVGARLQQWDPALFVDQTADGVSAPFAMVIETAPSYGPDPGAEKQLTAIQLDGKGSVTLSLLTRNSPDGSFTEVPLGPSGGALTVTMPYKAYPSALPLWREASLKIAATSASTWRLRSVELTEVVAGMPG